MIINVVNTIINRPFGNGKPTTYKNGEIGDGLLLRQKINCDKQKSNSKSNVEETT